MQEKPLLTQPQLAYPNKNYIINLVFFKHELRTISPKKKKKTQSIIQIVRILSCHILLSSNFHGDTQRHK